MGKTAVLPLTLFCALAFCGPAWACGCDANGKKIAFTERAKKATAKIAANVEKLKKKVAGN